jgi:flavin reductase (DIM6/NTAB) family NADH-FMN oxidoreductase RutF
VTLDPDTFRSVLGRFASGVTVVTTRDDAGRDYGMTVSAFCSVSLVPPLVLICVDHAASSHDALLSIPYFAVNVLAAHQESISRRFSGLDEHVRFDGVGYSRGLTGSACSTMRSRTSSVAGFPSIPPVTTRSSSVRWKRRWRTRIVHSCITVVATRSSSADAHRTGAPA